MQSNNHGAGASGKNGEKAMASGGYRYEYVAEPPNYVLCAICHLPSRDPYLTDCCGSLFCYSCLQDKAKSVHGATCPNPKCPSPRAFKTFKNKQVERAVKDLKIYCINKNKGCGWHDKMSEIFLHLARNCQFEAIECSNQCGEMVQRQHYVHHVTSECQYRSVKCQYCRSEGPQRLILEQHKQTCPKFPVSCPNGCKIPGLVQEDLAPHRKVCPLEMIQCEYFTEGCTEKIARQHQIRHNKENVEKHLTLTKIELAKARNREKDVQNIATVRQDFARRLDAIKQDLTIKVDLEMSNVKRELATIRNDMTHMTKSPSTGSYRHW